MVKRQSFRLLSRRIISSYWPAMALLNKEPFFGGFHGFRRVHTANVKPRFPAKVSIDAGSSLWINASKVLSLKGSYDHCDSLRMKAIDGLSLNGCSDHFDRLGRRADDGFQKAHALAPYPQLARDLEVGLEEAKGASTRSMSDRGSYKGGKSLGFLDQPVPNKLIVAVDVDEVLGNFVSALNKFIADRYSSNHSVSEYHVYEFFRVRLIPAFMVFNIWHLVSLFNFWLYILFIKNKYRIVEFLLETNADTGTHHLCPHLPS
uniref:Uncharacterized protein n=1 Tax=Nelumbo nucifera TaxID=4432 RepID=A0A823A2S6_NELNU|nr:TPA_asm: hypothetical protein HUJ06_019143 [Nelumbo nucifera]